MKVNDYNLALLPQEAVDMLQDIQTLLNLGKYQKPIVSTPPSWIGRQGEEAYMITGATGRLYVCTSDQSSTSWSIVSTFAP